MMLWQADQVYAPRHDEQRLIATSPLEDYTCDAIELEIGIASSWERVDGLEDICCAAVICE